MLKILSFWLFEKKKFLPPSTPLIFKWYFFQDLDFQANQYFCSVFQWYDYITFGLQKFFIENSAVLIPSYSMLWYVGEGTGTKPAPRPRGWLALSGIGRNNEHWLKDSWFPSPVSGTRNWVASCLYNFFSWSLNNALLSLTFNIFYLGER